jgi:hypothetical protein
MVVASRPRCVQDSSRGLARLGQELVNLLVGRYVDTVVFMKQPVYFSPFLYFQIYISFTFTMSQMHKSKMGKCKCIILLSVGGGGGTRG